MQETLLEPLATNRKPDRLYPLVGCVPIEPKDCTKASWYFQQHLARGKVLHGLADNDMQGTFWSIVQLLAANMNRSRHLSGRCTLRLVQWMKGYPSTVQYDRERQWLPLYFISDLEDHWPHKGGNQCVATRARTRDIKCTKLDRVSVPARFNPTQTLGKGGFPYLLAMFRLTRHV